MPDRIVTVVDCPYCGQGVFLNVPAYFAKVEPGEEEYVRLPEDLDQRVITFDQCEHSLVPCPHLYIIDGSCAPVEAGFAPDQLLDFCYVHPAVEPFTEKTGIRFGLAPESLPNSDEPVKLQTPFVFEELDEFWSDRTAEGVLREFHIWGEVIFIEDVDRLHAELPGYHARLKE